MKRRKNLQLLMTSLICGSLLAGSQVGSAEELVPTFQLDEIVVTATRTLKQIQEVPASISVVTAKDIKEKKCDYSTGRHCPDARCIYGYGG